VSVILCSTVQQEAPKRTLILVIVMDETDQPPIGRNPLNKLASGRISRVEKRPLGPDVESLFLRHVSTSCTRYRGTNLPCEERGLFDDRGLYNLLAWEDTPCNGIYGVLERVRLKLTLRLISIAFRYYVIFPPFYLTRTC